MNYQETIDNLEKKQDQLLQDHAKWKPEYQHFLTGQTIPGKWEWNYGSDKERSIWLIINDIKESYKKSLSQEITSSTIEEAFKGVEGFTKQKEDIKNLLLLQKYAKAKNFNLAQKGRILCFVGSPGVGKTFFSKKYAKAMGRNFFKINVGGEGNGNFIVGGKPEHVGAKLGQIIKAIRETDSRDPVILIDEVDKTNERGGENNLRDTLLHVLDPEQNKSFVDNYIDVAVDISEITFILTANDEEKIPGPLKSRLEIVKLKGYDEEQKITIGKMIINETFQENYDNANRDLFEMEEEALRTLIQKNKNDEGIRQLKINLEEIIRWSFGRWAQQNEKSEAETKVIIDVNKINELFPEDPEKEEEESEEDKLRKKIKELEQENEELKNKNLLQLFKPLEFIEDKEYCTRHKKDTLQTVGETCALCKLEEQIKKFEEVITKENWETIEKIWQEQKPEWTEQSKKLQNGSEEQKELSQSIKSGIREIDKKFRRVQKSSHTASQNKFMNEDLPWIIGGGVILLLFGYYFGWLFTKKFKKKKKKTVLLSAINSGPPNQ